MMMMDHSNNNNNSNNSNSNSNSNMANNRTYQTLLACTVLYLTIIGKSLDSSAGGGRYYHPSLLSYDYVIEQQHEVIFDDNNVTKGGGGGIAGDDFPPVMMIREGVEYDNDIDIDTDEDIAWLNRIKIGDFLGSGAYTDTFDVTLLDDDIDNKRDYVIKFTGENKRFQEHDDYIKSSILAKEISDILTPHPNIPRTLYLAKSIPNPFWKNSTFLHLEVNKTSYEDHKRTTGRMKKSNYFSVSVVEKMIPTKEHTNHDHILDIPYEYVPCFWQRLFEIMDYLHSRNVILGDTKLWNFMIGSGGSGGNSSNNGNDKVIVFDFNCAEIYEPNATNTTLLKYGHYGNDKHDSVHEKDVIKIGDKRIKEFVDYQKQFHYSSSKYWKKKAKKSKYKNKLISQVDIKLLEDLIHVIKKHKPTPSFGWLLNNTEYFQKYKNDTCVLSW